MNAINKKKIFSKFENCSNKKRGMKLIRVYLEVVTLFVQACGELNEPSLMLIMVFLLALAS